MSNVEGGRPRSRRRLRGLFALVLGVFPLMRPETPRRNLLVALVYLVVLTVALGVLGAGL